MMRSWRMLGCVAAVALAAGCSTKLETGYEPRKLSDSTAERRAYYADPFTPEARAAAEERKTEFNARRPDVR